MVNRDTEWRTDLILPRVTFSDIAAVIEDRPKLSGGLKALLDTLRQLHHIWFVPRQWNHCNLDWREIRVQMQNRSLLAALQFLLFECIHQKSQSDAIHTARRLDYIRRQVCVCWLVEIRLLQNSMLVRDERPIFEHGPSTLCVASQIVVRAIRDALDFIELL